MRIELGKIQKRITRRDDRAFGIINYDIDNAYPQRVMDVVNASGIAKSCIEIFYKFIYAKGFQDELFGKKIVDGKKLTADKMLRENCVDYAEYGGFAIHFNYNILGERTTCSFIPFPHCRLGINKDTFEVNSIAVYDDWGRERSKKIDKDKIDYINLYNPDPDVVLAEIEAAGGIEKYKGQIYYHGFKGGLIYPLTYYDSEIEDIDTDGAIKLFKNGNIQRRFMASHMFVRYGQAEGGGVGTSEGGVAVNPDKKVSSGSYEEDEMVGTLKNFQGPENTNRIILVDVETPEQKPELLPFTQENTDKLFEYHETSTQDNIRKRFAIPTIFLDAIPGSLGLAQQMQDAYTFYNVMTSDERAIIEETYQALFADLYPGQNFKIKELEFKTPIQMQPTA